LFYTLAFFQVEPVSAVQEFEQEGLTTVTGMHEHHLGLPVHGQMAVVFDEDGGVFAVSSSMPMPITAGFTSISPKRRLCR
jgi:hypothetical protein